MHFITQKVFVSACVINDKLKSVCTSFSRIVKGFPEGEGGHSEFLFSLPRFAENEVSGKSLV